MNKKISLIILSTFVFQTVSIPTFGQAIRTRTRASSFRGLVNPIASAGATQDFVIEEITKETISKAPGVSGGTTDEPEVNPELPGEPTPPTPTGPTYEEIIKPLIDNYNIAFQKAQNSCSSISNEMDEMMGLSGWTTGLSIAGTVAGGTALTTGLMKSSQDQKADALSFQIETEQQAVNLYNSLSDDDKAAIQSGERLLDMKDGDKITLPSGKTITRDETGFTLNDLGKSLTSTHKTNILEIENYIKTGKGEELKSVEIYNSLSDEDKKAIEDGERIADMQVGKTITLPSGKTITRIEENDSFVLAEPDINATGNVIGKTYDFGISGLERDMNSSYDYLNTLKSSEGVKAYSTLSDEDKKAIEDGERIYDMEDGKEISLPSGKVLTRSGDNFSLLEEGVLQTTNIEGIKAIEEYQNADRSNIETSVPLFYASLSSEDKDFIENGERIYDMEDKTITLPSGRNLTRSGDIFTITEENGVTEIMSATSNDILGFENYTKVDNMKNSNPIVQAFSDLPESDKDAIKNSKRIETMSDGEVIELPSGARITRQGDNFNLIGNKTLATVDKSEIENIENNNAGFAAALDKKISETRLAQEKELSDLTGKSKLLGNIRTGALGVATLTSAGSTGTSIANIFKAGSVLTAMENCQKDIYALNSAKSALEANVETTDDTTNNIIAKGNKISSACSGFDIDNMKTVKNLSLGSSISSGIGAGTAAAGTVTSYMANTNKVRDDKTPEGKKKEKDLNFASNVLAGVTTGAAIASTTLGFLQLDKIKKDLEKAKECVNSF